MESKLNKRFWSKVKKNDGEGDCWDWLVGRNSDGFGQFWLEGQMDYSHRLVYEEFYGEIPRGLCVYHRCSNPGCVNPEHLYLGRPHDREGKKFPISQREMRCAL